MYSPLLKSCCGKVETVLGSSSIRTLNEYLDEPQKILNINSLNALIYFVSYTDIILNQPTLILNHNGNLLLNWVDKNNNDIEIEFKENNLSCYSETSKSDFNVPLNKKAIQVFLNLHS